jgi:ferric-dicitrate binding protein FerR (iron transport regulator)
MDDDIKKAEKLEKIVEMLEQGRRLSDEDMEFLMNDSEAMHLYKSLLNCKTAVEQEYGHDFPDVDKEWERFRQRKQQKRRMPQYFLWGAVSGVAASLIVFLYFWLNGGGLRNDEILAYQANDEPQQVMLKTGAGKQIALERNTQNEVLRAAGTSLDKSDTLELRYQTTNEGKIEMHTLSTPRGQDFKVILADGTAVWLNAESRLIYPSRFDDAERTVTLHGEAYFKIAGDAERPFVILTDNIQTRALGTELNVRNYAVHDVHVTLINGRAEVRSKQTAQYTKLLPGEDAHLTDDGSLDVKKVDLDAFIYWKEGYLYFDNVPLADVIQGLGRWYNVNIVFDNKEAMSFRVRYFCDRRDTLEQAVTLLNKMKKIKVELVDNTIIICLQKTLKTE